MPLAQPYYIEEPSQLLEGLCQPLLLWGGRWLGVGSYWCVLALVCWSAVAVSWANDCLPNPLGDAGPFK